MDYRELELRLLVCTGKVSKHKALQILGGYWPLMSHLNTQDVVHAIMEYLLALHSSHTSINIKFLRHTVEYHDCMVANCKVL